MSKGSPFIHVPRVTKSLSKRFEAPGWPESTYMVIPKSALCRFLDIKTLTVTGRWVVDGVPTPKTFTSVRGDGYHDVAQITELAGRLGRCGYIYTHISGTDLAGTDVSGLTTGIDAWFPEDDNQEFSFRILEVMPIPDDADSWALRVWLSVRFKQLIAHDGGTPIEVWQWLTTRHWLPGAPPPSTNVIAGSLKIKMGLLEFIITQRTEAGGAQHGVYSVSNTNLDYYTPKYDLLSLEIEVTEWWGI